MHRYASRLTLAHAAASIRSNKRRTCVDPRGLRNRAPILDQLGDHGVGRSQPRARALHPTSSQLSNGEPLAFQRIGSPFGGSAFQRVSSKSRRALSAVRRTPRSRSRPSRRSHACPIVGEPSGHHAPARRVRRCRGRVPRRAIRAPTGRGVAHGLVGRAPRLPVLRNSRRHGAALRIPLFDPPRLQRSRACDPAGICERSGRAGRCLGADA